MANSRTKLRGPAWLIVAAICLTAAMCLMAAGGCARLRGTGYEGDMGNWAQKLRPPADERKFIGIDQRSRDIERNLGVR